MAVHWSQVSSEYPAKLVAEWLRQHTREVVQGRGFAPQCLLWSERVHGDCHQRV
jgi:hypothetical protein